MLSFTENLWFGAMKKMNICREVLLFKPYLHKLRTVARGNAWKVIAAQLTAAPLSFKVDARAVRERFGGLVEWFKAKNREELVATGVSPEQSQLDVHLEEIVQKTDEPELANQANENNANEKQSKETEYVKDLREMACETLGETSKRKSEETAQLQKREEGMAQTHLFTSERGKRIRNEKN